MSKVKVQLMRKMKKKKKMSSIEVTVSKSSVHGRKVDIFTFSLNFVRKEI